MTESKWLYHLEPLMRTVSGSLPSTADYRHEGAAGALGNASDAPSSARRDVVGTTAPLFTDDSMYYTFDECKKKANDKGVASKAKNRFAWCLTQELRYHEEFCERRNGGPWICMPYGEEHMRLTLLGRGTRGSQTLRVDARMDDWKLVFGKIHADTPMSLFMVCEAQLPLSQCNPAQQFRTARIRDWMDNNDWSASIDASSSRPEPTATPKEFFDIDSVSRHTFDAYFIYGESAQTYQVTKRKIRCDAAKSANGGACLFDEVKPILYYLKWTPLFGPVTGSGKRELGRSVVVVSS